MAREIGRIETSRRPSGRQRFRVVVESAGQVYRISKREIAPGVTLPFRHRQDAEGVLEGVRLLIAQGYTVARAIGAFLPAFNADDLIENRLAEYLEHFRGLVRQGKRSPTTLAEIERYARPGGHFGFWVGSSSREVTFGKLEDWHRWLGERRNESSRTKRTTLSLKTQRNISGAFRAFLRRLHRRGEIDRVPEFPAIESADHAPVTVTLEQQRKILEAIKWPRRGIFLCAATEALRVGELRALEVSDFRDGRLRVARAVRGHGAAGVTAEQTKNRSAEWRELWSPELLAWLDWRLEQLTPEDRLRGQVVLFPNPGASGPGQRFTHEALTYWWRKACRQVGIEVALQEGTRHSLLTVLAGELPERMLQAFSRHRDAKSLSHYAKPRATRAAIQKITGGGIRKNPGGGDE